MRCEITYLVWLSYVVFMSSAWKNVGMTIADCYWDWVVVFSACSTMQVIISQIWQNHKYVYKVWFAAHLWKMIPHMLYDQFKLLWMANSLSIAIFQYYSMMYLIFRSTLYNGMEIMVHRGRSQENVLKKFWSLIRASLTYMEIWRKSISEKVILEKVWSLGRVYQNVWKYEGKLSQEKVVLKKV